MKTLKKFALAFMAALISVSFAACSDDEPTPTPTPEPEPEPIPVNPLDDHYFDIWVTVGSSGNYAYLVRNIADIEQPQTISFENQGTDVYEYMDEESIIHGSYYYQVAASGDRFSKLQISDEKGLVKVAERPFGTNTFKTYRYTHAWTSDDEFVIMACNGDRSDVVWTKLKDNGNSLDIVAEGSLNLPEKTPEVERYSTSGIARYRKSDNKILYIYCEYGGNDEDPRVYVATINASTMKVEDVDSSTAGAEMAGTAYGELLQDKVFMDENENLYVPVVTTLPNAESYTCRYSRIFRVKAGSTKVDTSWLGFDGDMNIGKIVTSTYIGNGKALLYIQNPVHTGLSTDILSKTGWGSAYNCYYTIFDIAANKATPLTYNGKELPFSKGTFAQLSAVLGDKVYLGVNPENEPMDIFVYDTKTGNISKGATVAEGYSFDRIAVMEKASE